MDSTLQDDNMAMVNDFDFAVEEAEPTCLDGSVHVSKMPFFIPSTT